MTILAAWASKKKLNSDAKKCRMPIPVIDPPIKLTTFILSTIELSRWYATARLLNGPSAIIPIFPLYYSAAFTINSIAFKSLDISF